MAIRKIIELGTDDVLRKHARKVERFDDRLAELLDDMAETMYAGNGAGLAAPQVGVLKRCCVIDVQDGAGLIELVNPEIVSSEGECTVIEGCLSVPGRAGRVVRPEKVHVKAQDRHGEPFELDGEGMLAVCLCHEIDHLDGIVYVDKMIEDVTKQMEQRRKEEAK